MVAGLPSGEPENERWPMMSGKAASVTGSGMAPTV